MMPIPRRKAVAKGRASIYWMLGLFVATQVALDLWVVRGHPQYIDPTWNYRLERLQARLAEAPGRPLVLVVGSSRPANGFAPSALADVIENTKDAPIVFNFATLGGGPVRETLTLRRLLAHGIRPEWVMIEVWPLFWADRGRYAEKDPIMRSDLYLTDVPVLGHVYRTYWGPLKKVTFEAAMPAYHNRASVIRDYLPFLAPRSAQGELEGGKIHYATLDDRGWLPIPWPRPDPNQFAANLEHARKDLEPALRDLKENGLKPHVDWALRKLLRTCRQEGIKVAMFYMPEHPVARTWYPPETFAAYTRYLAQISNEYGAPIVDARDWIKEEKFVDFCHLLPQGAREFSARFGRDVVQPLLSGRSLPSDILLQPLASGVALSPGAPGQ
jgi:hypothetical protein